MNEGNENSCSDNDFPIEWGDPGDAERFWMMDISHYPKPVSPLDFSLLIKTLFDETNKVCDEYDFPGKTHYRHINTYLYISSVYDGEPAEADALLESFHEKMEPIIANIGELWENEWLPEIKKCIEIWENYDLAAASAPELLDHLNETGRLLERSWEIHARFGFPALLAVYYFKEMYQDLFPDSDKANAYELLLGFENEFTRSDQELWDLSRQALASTAARNIIVDAKPALVMDKLAESSECGAFLADLNRYFRKHGKKSETVALSRPFFIEEPGVVIKTLQHYMTLPDTEGPDAEFKKAIEKCERRGAEAREKLLDYPSPVVEKFESALKAARASSWLGMEHTHWLDNMTSYEARRVILEAGLRLAKARVIPERDDIFYLTINELKESLQALPEVLGWDKVIHDRRAAEKRFSGSHPPQFMGMPPTVFPSGPIMSAFMDFAGMGAPPSPDLPPNEIQGSPGSAGVVKGVARVIHDLSEAERLNPGDILVTRFTLPPWTAFFSRIVAVVTDSGGVLSHSAVVARECGIPAVVGTGVATSVIKDGQTIEVDGNKGIVKMMNE